MASAFLLLWVPKRTGDLTNPAISFCESQLQSGNMKLERGSLQIETPGGHHPSGFGLPVIKNWRGDNSACSSSANQSYCRPRINHPARYINHGVRLIWCPLRKHTSRWQMLRTKVKLVQSVLSKPTHFSGHLPGVKGRQNVTSSIPWQPFRFDRGPNPGTPLFLMPGSALSLVPSIDIPNLRSVQEAQGISKQNAAEPNHPRFGFL